MSTLPCPDTLPNDTHLFAPESLTCRFNTIGPVFQALPDFLAKTNYQDILDDTNTPTQVAYKTSLPGMLWVQEQPQAAAYFNDYIAFHRKQQLTCWDVYPVMTETHGRDPKAVVLVDVGGSLGHQCAEFKHRFPQVPGRVVSQDLQGPISTAMSIPGVENMVHDMFTPQPIKGTPPSCLPQDSSQTKQ